MRVGWILYNNAHAYSMKMIVSLYLAVVSAPFESLRNPGRPVYRCCVCVMV